MYLSYTSSEFLLGTVMLAAALVALIMVLKQDFRLRGEQRQTDIKPPQDQRPRQVLSNDKLPALDVLRNRGPFLLGGFCYSLLFCLFAFNWTLHQEPVVQRVYTPRDDGPIEMKQTFHEPPAQQTPPQAPPPVMEPIPDELAPETPPTPLPTLEDFVLPTTPSLATAATKLPTPPPVAPPPPAPTTNTEIFRIVEQMPRFPGCENQGLSQLELNACAEQQLLKFIYATVKYPALASSNGIEGKASLTFVVEPDGSISNVKVIRAPGGGIAEEAVRVVSSFPRWIPGRQRNEPVRVQFSLPIVFKLQ